MVSIVYSWMQAWMQCKEDHCNSAFQQQLASSLEQSRQGDCRVSKPCNHCSHGQEVSPWHSTQHSCTLEELMTVHILSWKYSCAHPQWKAHFFQKMGYFYFSCAANNALPGMENIFSSVLNRSICSMESSTHKDIDSIWEDEESGQGPKLRLHHQIWCSVLSL